jgi:predicted ATPase
MSGHGQPGDGEQPAGLAERRDETADLGRLIATSRLVTLRGPGGSGKTRLLLELMAARSAEFPDGTFLVGCRDLRQPDLLAARVARALKISQEPRIPLTDTLADALAGRRLLLALDGIDAVPGACASLCQALLASAPGLRVVTTGREPLRAPGEVVWPVPVLGLPAAGETSPERAGCSPAVRLFAVRAAEADPCFKLDAGNCAAVTGICRAMGGLPLALELAAARLRAEDAGQVCASLAGSPGLADPSGTAAAAPPPQIMEAAIRWAHDQLEPAEQVLARRLSVFHSFSLEMAEQVCADEGLPVIHVSYLLAGLAAKALIKPEPRDPGRDRYRMPGAIRDFAAARLAEAGETDLLGRRLRDYAAQRADYLVRIAQAKAPVSWAVQRDLFRDYAADARNLREALAWCLDHGEIGTGLRICTELRIFWTSIGAQFEAAWWLDAFLGADDPSVPGRVRGPALADRAMVEFGLGDLAAAESLARAAIDLCAPAGADHFTAVAQNVLARAALADGRPQDALHWTAQTLDLARQGGDWWNETFALTHRSGALAQLGHPDEARACAEDGLALALRTGLHWAAAAARLGLGDLALASGDLDTAREFYEAALPFARVSMHRAEAARCLASLGKVALVKGDADQGREYLARSLRLSLNAGSRDGMARGLLGFADLAVAEGRPDRAVLLASAATAMREAAGLPRSPDRTDRYREAAAGLGPAEVARLQAAGRELTGREAARMALDSHAVAQAPQGAPVA